MDILLVTSILRLNIVRLCKNVENYSFREGGGMRFPDVSIGVFFFSNAYLCLSRAEGGGLKLPQNGLRNKKGSHSAESEFTLYRNHLHAVDRFR